MGQGEQKGNTVRLAFRKIAGVFVFVWLCQVGWEARMGSSLLRVDFCVAVGAPVGSSSCSKSGLSRPVTYGTLVPQ